MTFLTGYLPLPCHWACSVLLLSALACPVAKAAEPDHAPVGENQNASTWVGTCPNGEPYRLHAYRQGTAEKSLPYYDYQGPVGQGTVQVNTLPQVMVARVCIKTAEIINRDYLNR